MYHSSPSLKHLMASNYDSAMGEVIPGLWVGNLICVSKMLQLIEENVNETHLTIISLLSNRNMIRLVTDILEQYRLKDGANSHEIRIRHEIIELKDSAEVDLSQVLPEALMLIDDALGHQTTNIGNISQRRICLVHCTRGASRSVSFVVAYLLSRHGSRFKSLEDALQQVRRVRPIAQPNIGFSLALRKYERSLHGEDTKSKCSSTDRLPSS